MLKCLWIFDRLLSDVEFPQWLIRDKAHREMKWIREKPFRKKLPKIVRADSAVKALKAGQMNAIQFRQEKDEWKKFIESRVSFLNPNYKQ